jgi:hypothetical protein
MKPWIITDFRPECDNSARERTRQLVRVSEGDPDGFEISLSTQEVLRLLNSFSESHSRNNHIRWACSLYGRIGPKREIQTLTLRNRPRRCQICDSTDVEVTDYCGRHSKALKLVVNGHQRWSSAYGRIAIDEYLFRLQGRVETGREIKDVASFLAKDIGRWPG